VVEWSNVSMGCEIFEQGDTPVFLAEGFAYVGVSAQRVGVHGFDSNPQGLRYWDVERYGTLDVGDDTLSYGIFSQVAEACGPGRAKDPVDPLGGLAVDHLIGIGGSQSAARLVTYINAIHGVERRFDGFMVFTWFGSGSSLDDSTVLNLARGLEGTPPLQPCQIRDDVDVPVMVVNSECETLSCFRQRRPDSDRYRYWEVAGAPHGPRPHMERIVAKLERDGIMDRSLFDFDAMVPIPWAPAFDAALVHTQRWVRGGDPPPSQEAIVVEGASPRVGRDGSGNARGGVRLPDVAVPLGRSTGAIEEAGSSGLLGHWAPFTEEEIRARYPSSAAYVEAYQGAAEAAVAAGVLCRIDADAGVRRAASMLAY